MTPKNKKFIVLSSPSGGGKSTVTRHILSLYPNIRLSISATTRNKRPKEKEGVDYFYLSKDEFEEKIAQNKLVEYEEIFGNYYGTLKSELQNAIDSKNILIFDVDVKGAFSIQKHYPEESLLIFLMPPNIETLEQRLRNRRTETEEQIQNRLSRAKKEIELSEGFEYVIYNNILAETLENVEKIIEKEIFC